MPELRLTKSSVEALPFERSGQVLYRDTTLPGFGVRVGRRSKTYFVEAQVERRTVRTSIGRADVYTTDIARKKAVHLLANMYDGRNPNDERRHEAAANITLARAFDDFFENRRSLAASSRDSYARTLRVYFAAWAKKPIRSITRQMVLRKHQQLTNDRGPYTANAAMRHLRSVYNFVASTQDGLPENPVHILTQARTWNREKRRQTVITAHDLPAWWEAVMNECPDAKDFLLVALFTAMRRNEVAQLRWTHIDLENRKLHIPNTKNGDPLELPLSDFLIELFQRRRAESDSDTWVFPGTGRTGHVVEVKSFVGRVVEASGVEFTMHDLRRTFITIAESLDIPHYALKRLLNHRSNGDVTGGYIVMNADRLRQPVEKVTSRILEIANAE